MIERMKYPTFLFMFLLLAMCIFSQQTSVAAEQQAGGADQKTPPNKTKKTRAGADQKSGSAAAAPAATQDPALEAVLSQMDAAANNLHSAEADLTQETYEKVVEDHHTENGKIYFRKTNKGLQIAMDFSRNLDSKYVLLTDNKVRYYQPKIDQVTEYTINGNRADVESMFALGFGGRGHDLLKSFDVKLIGSEMMDGNKVVRLELTPETETLKRWFSRIELWIDPNKDISLQQQFWQASGDYRLAHFNNIKLTQKLPDDVFKLKTTGRTKVVTP